MNEELLADPRMAERKVYRNLRLGFGKNTTGFQCQCKPEWFGEIFGARTRSTVNWISSNGRPCELENQDKVCGVARETSDRGEPREWACGGAYGLVEYISTYDLAQPAGSRFFR